MGIETINMFSRVCIFFPVPTCCGIYCKCMGLTRIERGNSACLGIQQHVDMTDMTV